jgi:hypothetical protein
MLKKKAKMDTSITKDAQIAKLWSQFHRLSKDDQKVVIALSQYIRDLEENSVPSKAPSSKSSGYGLSSGRE